MKRFVTRLVFSAVFITASFISVRAAPELKEALFYDKADNKNVQCRLCPRMCFIPDGKRGFCRARENREGTLYSIVYGRPVAVHVDPIEKKPFFHFLPGTTAFSLATAGCNMRCSFCQNWEISQVDPGEVRAPYVAPVELVAQAKQGGCASIAYTYTEPTIFYEYMLETAVLAKEQGIKNVMHSNGFINEEPLRRLARYLDAANIDLKGCTEEYYASMAQGSLEPVLRSLKILKEEGVHIEITNLLVPGYNDDAASVTALCSWIKENLGDEVPVHFSRFFPMYKLLNLQPTPVESVERAVRIAKAAGLKYVYVGNVGGHGGEDTVCPVCGTTVIDRKGNFVLDNKIKDGKCPFCNATIAGVWQ